MKKPFIIEEIHVRGTNKTSNLMFNNVFGLWSKLIAIMLEKKVIKIINKIQIDNDISNDDKNIFLLLFGYFATRVDTVVGSEKEVKVIKKTNKGLTKE